MNNTGKTILVLGATGKQGGAVAEHLLKDGWHVRALTREPGKAAARALAKKDAEIIKGDLEHPDDLARAIQGVYGVFSMQASVAQGNPDETGQGKAVLDAAQAGGVQHVVYSSVGGANRNTGIPHFESKWQVEQHLGTLNLPATILRPVFFMDNFASADIRPSILSGTLTMPLPANTPLQMIAVDDIGAFAALAFSKPEEFIGKAYELAGDKLTMMQAAEIFGRVIGRHVKYVEAPLERIRNMSPDMASMFEWFIREGYQGDIPTLRALHPQLLTLEAWLRKHEWDKE